MDLVFHNDEDSPVTIVKIAGSCACQHVTFEGQKIKNGSTISKPVAARASASIGIEASVRPGPQELAVAVTLDSGATAVARVSYLGLAPVSVRPPEHYFENAKLGSEHRWSSKIASTNGSPFELTTDDDAVELTSNEDKTEWTLVGTMKCDGEGPLYRSHRCDTNLKEVPFIQVSCRADVRRRVDLPSVVNVSYSPANPIDYRVRMSIRDESLAATSVRLEPSIDGVSAALAGGEIILSGCPSANRVASAKLIVSFSDPSYPDAESSVVFLRRSK